MIGAAGGVLYLGNKGWLPQMFNHAYERIATLRDPFIDSHGAGYQMTHSFYALYNGGIWGNGLFLLGFGTLLFVQTIMNVGSIAGLMPMTGVPLPFVSYGGTSYLILSLGIGITLNISSKIQAEELPLYRPEKQ